MDNDLARFLTARMPALIGLRRQLHAYPELSHQEFATTALVAEQLREAGLSPQLLSAGTGLICDIGSGGPVVALRADLDALPLQDHKRVAYRSTVAGVSHACGHDVHTAVVLGCGLALAEGVVSAPGRVRLIFQPAEEVIPGGALTVIEEGGLAGVSSIYAIHVDPSLEAGRIGLRPGAITAASDTLVLRLTGAGGHTSRPHLTTDVVYAAARVITDLPGALSRLVDPRAGLSVVFGSVEAGAAANVIPGSAQLLGTLRALDTAVWKQLPELVDQLIRATVEPLGAGCEIDYRRGMPPVVNDHEAVHLLDEVARRELGEHAVTDTPQSMGGEDFAWYLEHVPGAMARLGARPAGPRVDLHTTGFDVDERAIPAGIRVLTLTAVEALRRAA